MNNIERIKELTDQLHKASVAYYKYDNPIYTDKKYDEKYDELEQLENKTGIRLSGSPTQKVQGFILDGLQKQKHSKPMLSANKTKDVKEIKKFLEDRDFYASYKLDGLTLVIIYEEGKLQTCLTRGSGEYGEIVTEQAKMISNLPMEIQYKERLELRGECVISWSDFNYLNDNTEEQYAHPRNAAAGAIRNLNTSVARDRMLQFVVFECITDLGIDSKFDTLKKVNEIGFTVNTMEKGNVEDLVEELKFELTDYPCDGIIFEIDSRKESKSMGITSHHECCRMALKSGDETYETTFKEIEWNTTRTGQITPTAIFEPVLIQGSIVSRATLHNLSYIEELELGIGDKIEVYKSNMIIPKIHDNLTRSNTWEYPKKCPCCGERTEIHNENGSKTLHCNNDNCTSKLLGRLELFVSKEAMNIDGMSSATLQTFIDNNLLHSIEDIYSLNKHRETISKLQGFGQKSVDKLMFSIELSCTTTMAAFIRALGINLIGKTQSKELSKYCRGNIYKFNELINNKFNFSSVIDGFGSKMNDSIYNWFSNEDNNRIYNTLLDKVYIEENTSEKTNQNNKLCDLNNMAFCITGKLNLYKNRDELVGVIESCNGKYVSSVTSKTNYLINNDIESKSGKNKKAIEVGCKIISEEDFKRMIE